MVVVIAADEVAVARAIVVEFVEEVLGVNG